MLRTFPYALEFYMDLIKCESLFLLSKNQTTELKKKNMNLKRK